MRQNNLASFLIFSPLFLLFLFFGRNALGQTTDLRIDFSGPQPDFVQVGAFFAIQATVSFDVNGTNPVPAGETVIANIEFRDPSGLIVASHVQQWNGFPENGNPNTLSNSTPNNGQVLFQVPWSEDDKWNAGPDGVPGTADDGKWTIAARVSGASQESDLSDNQISHQFSLSLPNLTVSNNLGISSRDPISGATSSQFFPNSNVSVTGSVQNDSLVRTQEGVMVPVTAKLIESETGNVVDEQIIVIPDPGQSPVSIIGGQIIPFTIDDLRIPSTASLDSNFTVEVIVDEQPNPNIPSDGIMPEAVEDHVSNPTDNRSQATFSITSANAVLSLDQDSFKGETGNFSGLDPIRISFSLRNIGPVSIQQSDVFTAQVTLSKDDVFSGDDFILREFDLGGNALGRNLMPNETILLDWVQQLPDNLEGDFYLILRIVETNQSFSVSTTPLYTLTTKNNGLTRMFSENPESGGQIENAERPDTSSDGQRVVYEATHTNGIQQIFMIDSRVGNTPVLISHDCTNRNAAANFHCLRPAISADGSHIVFYSKASNLIPGDTNGHEDVFLYSTYTGKITAAFTQEIGNEGSFYPDISGDGRWVVFQSDATNLLDNETTNGRQIFLWDTYENKISLVSNAIDGSEGGNGESRRPSVSDDGLRIVFESDASNLVMGDTNNYTDVFYFNAITGGIELLSKSVSGNLTNNACDQAKISGNGNFAIFRSKATNIIEGKGISFISVDRGGAGYFGSPTILVNDLSGNGQNAEIQFAQNGINQYGQISPAGLIIISSGENYVNPSISIVPDPSQPAPTQDAIISAYISHPQGEIYRIEINAGQSSLTRVSENSIGVGGNMPSMDPGVSSDGSVVVYSTQASNLLDQNVTRADGTTFYNQVTNQAQAEAILVGPIGEIEIASTGSGYQNGFLTINDLSGIGSGAAASYQVDSFGKISSISIINAGTDYNLDTTVVTVENPRGGTGFVAGELRFQKEFGLGSNRTGGARIHRIEMSEHGRGYASIASNIQGLSSLISISGDGEDSDDDGLPDAMINSELVKIHADTGAIYLEQRFVIEVMSSTSLIGTTLSIEDANKSVEYSFALADSLPNTIGIQDPANNFRSNSEICDEIIKRIEQWSGLNSDSIWIKPQVLNQVTGGTTFTLSTLSGKVSVNNSTSLKVTPQSNMLFSGSGFTRAIPLIAPPPIIHGFSEILSSPNNTNISSGRILPLYEPDMVTDDIYLFDFKTQRNERVSKSTFGYPVNFLPSNLTAMPSNRFPTISGNGRHVYFTTDSTGASGLAFGNTNQTPLDNDSFRDLIYHDRMVIEAESPSTVSAIILNPSPANPAQNFFPLGSLIDISVEVNSTFGNVEDVELFLDGSLVNLTQTFPTADPTLGRFSRSGIYGFSWTPNRPGEYVLSVQATDNVGRKSKITGSSTAVITIGNDPLGISPVIQMTEPVPGGFGDTFPDYSIGSELFINVEAYDPDGFLEYVHIYYNGQFLGEAQSRFDDTYIYKWQIRVEEDFVLHAETRDNDGNIVRSGSLSGSNFQNSESDPPEVRIDSITVESTGLRIRAIAEGDDSGGLFGFGGGISRVQFFANGVTLGAVGGQTGGGFFTVLPTGEQEFIFDWEPENAGSYNFYAMAVGNVGDMGDHYVLSEAFPFEILPEHMGSISDENAPPNVKLINPGTHTVGAASAIAILAETNSTDAGKIINLRMTDIGHSYTEAPKVNIYGGGGYDAAAIANLQNGSVSKVHIINGGSGYSTNLQLQAVQPANGRISKITPNVLNGVIKSVPVLNSGFGYSASDTVAIFDLKNSAKAGLGARASLSVNDGGEITQINIIDGGYNYDLSTIKVSIIGQGVGFEADINNTIISDGVVSYISVDDAGSGYTTGFTVSTVPGTEGAGSGFSAEVKDEDIVNGAISLNLISGGEDYSSAPTVIISEGRRANNLTPMVVAEGSRVFLEAEAFDSDGNIDEVRFYGNGNLLGSAPLGNVLNVNVINPGFGFVNPPEINFIGGGGFGATATAVLDQNGSVTGVQMVTGGQGYTSAPLVQVTPSNGVILTATIDDQIVNIANRVPETDRYYIEWVPNFPGQYVISVEAVDNDNSSTLHTTEHNVIVTPKDSSKAPSIRLLGPTNGNTYTTGSELRAYAQASDIDGGLDWIKFYVNGDPIDAEQTATNLQTGDTYPYSQKFTLPDEGTYTFFAMVMDNSGNCVMSRISTITSTNSSGSFPSVAFTGTTSVAKAKIRTEDINANGGIESYLIENQGNGYVNDPEIRVSGDGSGAVMTAIVEKDPLNPNFGKVVDIQIVNPGYGYTYAEIELLQGFAILKPSGETADAVLGFGLGVPTIRVTNPGDGYVSPPSVVIDGNGNGMEAEAVVANGSVTQIQITNPGTGYTRGTVELVGGFAYNEQFYLANANDSDGVIQKVTFYENGVPVNTDFFYPYEFGWSPGPPGYYDLYFEVTDNKGNKTISDIMRREVFYSNPPIIEFEPAIQGRISTIGLIQNESFVLGPVSNFLSNGNGYHSAPRVIFNDSNGNGAAGYASVNGGKIESLNITNGGSGYTNNSTVRFAGGLNTTYEPILMELGKSSVFGIHAEVENGIIRRSNLRLFINGIEDNSISFFGTEPKFSFVWEPLLEGRYEFYVTGSVLDGLSARTDTMVVEVLPKILDNPNLGSLYPSTSGTVQEVTILRRYERRAATGTQAFSAIRGLNSKFLDELSVGQIIRFSVDDLLTSNSYTIKNITANDQLELEGELSQADQELLKDQVNLQIVNVYRAGSLVPLNLSDDVEDGLFQSVSFYADGILIDTDNSWPFSTSFIPESEGTYIFTTIAEDASGNQAIHSESIVIEPRIGNLPDGNLQIIPDVTMPHNVTKASELICIANYIDLDDGMNRVEFYLNGKLKHVDKDAPYSFRFTPESDDLIGNTARNWEVTALGFDKSGNTLSRSILGSISGSELLPSAEVKSPSTGEEFSSSQTIKLEVQVKGVNLDKLLGGDSFVTNPNTALTPRTMNILANGVQVAVATETNWGSGIFSSEWICDDTISDENGDVEILGLIVLEDTIVQGQAFTPVLISEGVKIKITEPNVGGDPKAALTQVYIDLINQSPTEQQINLSISDNMESGYIFENDDFLQLASHLTEREIFQNTVDAIAGYHTMTGYWPDYLKIKEIIQKYSAIPNFGADGSLDADGDGFSFLQERLFRTSDQDPADIPSSAFSIGSFVDDTLSSRDFTDVHGVVPELTPPAAGPDRFTNYDKNRRGFVRTTFTNKYGRPPTVQQEIQGSYRISVFDPNSAEARQDQQRQMFQQLAMYSNFGAGGVGGAGGGGRGGNNNNQLFQSLLGGNNNNQNQQPPPTYSNGQPAVLYVVNMIAEEKIDSMDMIWNAGSKRDYYNTAALITSFWQSNLEVLSDSIISQFHGLSDEQIIAALMRDKRYFDRFGGYSISRLAQKLDGFSGWKWLDWFGYFNDEKFPWVYHSELGWVYVYGPSTDQVWFYIPDLGWAGTTKDIWKNMDSRSAYLWLYHNNTARWIFYVLDPDVLIDPNDSDRGTFRKDSRLPLENDPNFKKTFWDSVLGKYFTYE